MFLKNLKNFFIKLKKFDKQQNKWVGIIEVKWSGKESNFKNSEFSCPKAKSLLHSKLV